MRCEQCGKDLTIDSAHICAQIIDLSERQPSFAVNVPEARQVWVVPVSLVRDVANGRKPLSALDECVIRGLLRDFLYLEAKQQGA